ncbi:MAG: YmfQ family protein [Treponema sp.]|jgi:uncharacterized protein YmfQ (DUF2313 family)|nr:YmfQ family protein [Treponema sp.]
MGITVPDTAEYEKVLRKLFPRGSYWDRQFADPESDCSLFCRAKAADLYRFRSRMSDLQNESAVQTAAETLPEWERVVLNGSNGGLTVEQRRMLLIKARAGNITVSDIVEIGSVYGITVHKVEIPFRAAFFGFARCGIDHIAGPQAFSVVHIYADGNDKQSFETEVVSRLPSNQIVFFYGGE